MQRLTQTLKPTMKRQFSGRPKFVKFNYQDALNMDSLLTSEEREIAEHAETFFQEEFMPTILTSNRHEKFDRSVYKKLGDQGFLGCTLKDYGGMGVSSVSYGLINKAIERVDSAYRSALSVQNALVIFPIATYASKGVKDKYLEALIAGDLVGCFGLTEPDHGSDPGSMASRCRKTSDGQWVLNGSKTWITSSPIAEVFVVWAKDAECGTIRGFVLDRSMQGISTPKIEGKLSLRASDTGMIMMDDVQVSDEHRLDVEGLKGPFSCLNNARFGISWGVWGAAEFCYHFTRDYLLERKQFDAPLAGFQLPQKRLAEMASEIAIGQLACLQVSRLKDSNQLAPEMVSMIKRNSCMKSLEISRNCRELLGGNGIVDEYHVMRHMVNLETVNTYEGTNDIHALILGRGITGIQSFSRQL
jgi:glutaryl-CoA dehydrogenase